MPIRYTTARRVSLILSNNLSHGFVIGSFLAAGVLVACAVVFFLAEDVSIGGAFLWVTRTLLQQEPPYEPATGVGQFLYFVVVITGVGIIAFITAGIASRIIQWVMRKDSGMGRAKYQDHIVICGWSPKGHEILRELHADEIPHPRPVAIVAPLPINPSEDDLVTFVQGRPSDADVLKRAGIERAETAIILADHSNAETGADERDAMTLLTALAVEALNPNVHTCVEVIRSQNLPHFQRAKVDEVVVSAELAGNVLAASAMNHGISHVLSDLTGHEAGNEFYGVEAPATFAGRSFGQVMEAAKASADAILVGVASNGFRYELNPPSDRIIEPSDRLLLIAHRDPTSKLGR